jgi:hypothetical protein
MITPIIWFRSSSVQKGGALDVEHNDKSSFERLTPPPPPPPPTTRRSFGRPEFLGGIGGGAALALM